MSEKLSRILPPKGNIRPPSFSDIDAAEKAGLTIPSASDQGGQTGRVPPAVRKITAQYEAVDLNTATARMIARQKGEMPAIAGGIDGPGQIDEDRVARFRHGQAPDVGREAVEQAAGDAPDAIPNSELTDVLRDVLQQALDRRPAPPPPPPAAAHNTQLADLVRLLTTMQQPQATPVAEVNPFNPGPMVDPGGPLRATVTPIGSLKASPAVEYLTRRTRVSFTVAGGTYSVPAVDVQLCDSGLVILLPLDKESATFVPSLGAEVAVGFGGKRWDCFFPGIAVSLDALGVQVLGFVYQNDKQAQAG